MRLTLAVLALFPFAALAQQQEAATPPEAGAGHVYDIVAADRETAWRINRITGEITVCRIDTTGSLDAVRARCAAAAIENPPQQAQKPAGRP